MRYGSVCSGIEACSVAWLPLGWTPAFYAEIAKFPSAVLAHHFSETRNLGDFTKIKNEEIDLLVGGTPCQSFSVAGDRKGMDDDRGNLSLEFIKLADRLSSQWIIWENVPGVLSSNDGRDFATFVDTLAKFGYGFAYRVLDAQHFGVPQQRRRVFLVGYRGDWRPAAAVLFEQGGCDLSSLETGSRNVAIDPIDGDTSPSGWRLTSRIRDPFRAYPGKVSTCLHAKGSWAGNQVATVVHDSKGVRVLTPLELERLQGFPDGWTDVSYRGGHAPIGLRTAAIGNSMAVPVIRWLGKRIETVDKLVNP